MQVLTKKQIERADDASRITVSDPSAVEIAGADSLHDTLGEIADSFDVTGFKCAKCGLVHGHDTMKHRLSDTFDISEDAASDMEYNSVCHCGVQGAARNGNDVGIDEGRAASIADNAPIPPEVAREMDEQLGTV